MDSRQASRFESPRESIKNDLSMVLKWEMIMRETSSSEWDIAGDST